MHGVSTFDLRAFYYHVKQLREKACESLSHNRLCEVETQEVVPLFIKDDVTDVPQQTNDRTAVLTVLRFDINGITVEIKNAAMQEIVQNTVSALKRLC